MWNLRAKKRAPQKADPYQNWIWVFQTPEGKTCQTETESFLKPRSLIHKLLKFDMVPYIVGSRILYNLWKW